MCIIYVNPNLPIYTAPRPQCLITLVITVVILLLCGSSDQFHSLHSPWGDPSWCFVGGAYKRILELKVLHLGKEVHKRTPSMDHIGEGWKEGNLNISIDM